MRGYLGVALTAALVGSLGVAPAAGAAAAGGTAAGPPSAGAAGACEVHVMKGPDGAFDGTVMDIERVPGKGVVYYGSMVVPQADGTEARRAFVWYGLGTDPVPVGPAGTLWDVAFELTPSGWINGQSTMDESGREQAWVQNLRTGALTWVETGQAEGIYVRRINDRGEPVGTLHTGEFTSDAAWWPWADRPPRLLGGGDLGSAEAWAINHRRDVTGSYAVEVPEGIVPQGVVWTSKGAALLASNPGVAADTFSRVLSDAGQSAGGAWYGPWDGGHYEAARWPEPGRIESLGLLPGGGFSGVYGQSENGWVTGVADVFDPESPGAAEWGAVDHSVLWTDNAGTVRVLPSPYADAHGLTDWSEWYGGVAHGVNDRLDQVGSASHVGWGDDGALLYGATVFVNASACGEAVPTTHTAFWNEPSTDAAARRLSTAPTAQPDAYRHGAVRERVSGRTQ
ncbi:MULTISPECIES: hypothetical protein [Microbacterium]|uniref:hypothetical protein n=1 Tax=Microbacterium TaxID=33882 RepID=UPI000D649E4E|nr:MULTISPECIES: hypothetical protein [Microbacterium]